MREEPTAEDKAKAREALQLLKDWMPFFSPFGGAAPMDSTLNLEAQGAYGPAGLIFAGTEFDREHRRRLLESFADLWGALVRLQREEQVGKHANGDAISGFAAYNALYQVYLEDPGDASVVDDLRRKLSDLDRENQLRAKQEPPKPPRVAMVWPRRFLEKHDAGLADLAQKLKDVDLYVVFPKLMSEREEKEMQHKNTEMYAVFQRLRRSGLSVPKAMAQAAENFDVPVDVIERIVEFRSEDKPDECIWEDCDRAPFSQNLCQKHYQQRWRAGKRKEKKS